MAAPVEPASPTMMGSGGSVTQPGDVAAGGSLPMEMTCQLPEPGAAPIRRMTHFEYNNTIRDLLGDDSGPANGFGVEEEALGFNNNAANLVTSSALAEKYMLAAEAIAARATQSLADVVACDPVAQGLDACGQQFIADFGKRAFRRPLSVEEVSLFSEQFATGAAEGDFATGIGMVIETALQSPAFLYRVEFGEPATDAEPVAGDVLRLNPWETASRLSYLLWASMPDAELFDAAENLGLETKEQIAAQARRLLEDPRARPAVSNFHQQWLDYDRISNVGKDATLFPEWSSSIGALMREETRAFLDDVVFSPAGNLSQLLTSPRTFLNAELAALYGASGPTGAAFEPVTLSATERAGVLTLAALLTINAHSNQTSPVHRGLLVRERFLCDLVPPPPPDVMVQAPDPSTGATARERFAAHSANAACAACHSLMDPLGFGFENYDALGRYRSEENGAPIDASGVLTSSDVDGPFSGVVELAGKLAQSQDVEDCYVKQWFRFAYGRGETAQDECTLTTLNAQFSAAQGNIKELLVALTQTDAFLYRPTVVLTAGGTP